MFGWSSLDLGFINVGKGEIGRKGGSRVELLEVLRVTLLFQAGISSVPCSNSSDFPLLSLLLIARASYPCLAYRIG